MFAVGQLFTVTNEQHTTVSNTYHLLDSMEVTASTALASLCVGLHVAPSAGPHLSQSFPFVFSTVFVVRNQKSVTW